MLEILQSFFPSLVALSIVAAPGPEPAQQPLKAKPKPAAPPAAKAQPESPAGAIASKVQKFYESTKDFSADFIQIYTRVALSKTSESRGTVKVLKPGMMRWDYSKPEPKHFIADGKQLFVYDPEDAHVTIDPQFQISDQSSSLSFLWGQGKLSEEFEISLGENTELGAPKELRVLVMKPKKDATYSKLLLVVDPATGQVKESILHETTGNLNRFKFDNMKTNLGLKPAEFQFTPPPGTEVSVIKR
jgi:outer membrane lipoprotein carrier protein